MRLIKIAPELNAMITTQRRIILRRLVATVTNQVGLNKSCSMFLCMVFFPGSEIELPLGNVKIAQVPFIRLPMLL